MSYLIDLIKLTFYLRIGTSQFDDQKKSRLRWFGHVERKDDNDWVKHITWEGEGIRPRGRLKKRPGGIVLRMTWKAVQKGCAVQE